MDTQGQSHKPGIWKQQNKSHKSGRHRTKGQIEVQQKGRQNVKVISKRKKEILRKSSRRNRTQQIRSQKREIVLNQKRSIGVGDSPPHLVAFVPLHHSVDVGFLLDKISNLCQEEGFSPSYSPLPSAGFTVNLPRIKHRFQVIKPASCSILDVLNCCIVADSVVFLVSAFDCIDETGEQLLSGVLAQGVSSVLFCVSGIADLRMKLRNPTKKEITKVVERHIADPKLLTVDSDQEVFNLMRMVGELKRKPIGQRSGRPYMVVDKMDFLAANEDVENGTLKLCGYVRGWKLDINRLVHLVGWGEFQVQKVEEIYEHCPWNVQRNKPHCEDSMDQKAFEPSGRMLQPDESKQQDLVCEAEVDPLDAEQTWPTEDEIHQAEEEFSNKQKLTKKVPKGTSDYQAAWILDEDEDWEELSDEEMEEEDKDGVDIEPAAEIESQLGEDDIESVSMSTYGVEETASQYDEKMGEEEDEEQLKRFRDERSHQMFPDEIDTPMDVQAKIRFQKYRGLKSFRTSPWDPKENLPSNYARIFQFQSFENMKKRVRKINSSPENCFQYGTCVAIYLKNVPKVYYQNHSPNSTLAAFGLFPHEQKMSVLHFALKHCGEKSIKSKDELLFQVGFRQFKARPIFSQHSLGSKHKMERYFSPNSVVLATVYAPITFPPANVMAFKPMENGEVIPVATGTLYKVDPDRVIVKRIVLTGHPFRINKRSATIRYMFFNRDDVTWFKPVELRTKWGRRGHIKEPLGTHGHMKCIFDSQLTSQDTVMMLLYKRVFPPWSHEPVTPSVVNDKESTFDEEMFH